MHFQPLLTAGLSGFLVSGPAFVVAAIAIADTAAVLSGRRVAGFIAAAVLVANPSLLYLQAVPMTEMLMVASLAVTADLFARWLRHEGVGTFLWLAVALAAGTMVRYEGWMVLAAASVIVMMWTLSRGTTDPVRAEALAIAVAAPGALAITLYLMYNWLIFGSPLAFALGEFSAKVVGAGLSEAAGTEGDLEMSLRAYGSAGVAMAGVVSTAIAVLSLVILASRRSDTHWALIVLVLLTPLPFNLFAIYEGSSVVVTPHISDTYINARYGVLMLPAVALLVGLLAGFPRQRQRRRIITGAVAAALVLQLGSFAVAGVDGVAAVADYRSGAFPEFGRNEAVRLSAQRWAETYDGGSVLIDVRAAEASTQLFLLVAGISHSRYITLDNNVVWEDALAAPASHARWLIETSDILGRPSIITSLFRSHGDAVKYELVYDERGFQVYRLKPAFDVLSQASRDD